MRWVDAIVFLLGGVCHQLPDRCLLVDGQPLPLCARCMGTFIGMTAGLVLPWLIGERRASRLPPRSVLVVMSLALGAWFLDGLNSFVALVRDGPLLYEPSNLGRLLTGTALGLAVGAILYAILQYALWQESDARRLFAQPAKAWWLVLAGALIVATIYLGSGLPYALWVAILALATLVPLTLANTALVLLILGKEGIAERGAVGLLFLAMGLVCALLETGGMALLRYVLIGARGA